MKAFLKYCFTVSLITGLVSAAFFYTVNKGLRRQRSDTYGKLNELLENHDTLDIAFIGSSRVNMTVDPRVIDSVTGLRSFNFGFDGATIIDFDMYLDAFLAAHPRPELIVLNIDPKMLNVRTTMKVPPSRYLPYTGHAEMYDSLKNYSQWPVVARYMPFVATSFYTDAIVYQSIQGYLAPDRRVPNYYKGFSPLEKAWPNADKSMVNVLTVEYTPKGITLFGRLLQKIHARNIPLYLMYSPQYYAPEFAPQHDAFMAVLRMTARAQGDVIHDYSGMDICRSKQYFFDAAHLDTKGAELFSLQLAKDLRAVLRR